MMSLFAKIVVMALVFLAGCSNGEPEQGRWGGLVSDLRVQWSAKPGIDLLTGVSVPVRAYFESYYLFQLTGAAEDLYPGFTEAVPQNELPDWPDPSAWDRRPSSRHPIRAAVVGNLKFRINSVQASGGKVAVTVCYYKYGAAEQFDNSEWVSLVTGVPTPFVGIDTVRVVLVAPEDQSKTILSPHQGGGAAPEDDVFGGWQIVGYLTPSSSAGRAQWPTYRADEAACVEAAPDPYERREFLITGDHPRSDFPTSPPSPGWPEGTS